MGKNTQLILDAETSLAFMHIQNEALLDTWLFFPRAIVFLDSSSVKVT